MTFTVEKMSNENITIITYGKEISQEILMATIRQNEAFMNEAGHKMYTIVDTRQLDDVAFPTIIGLVKRIKDEILSGRMVDPSAMTCFVGRTKLNTLWRDLLVAQGAELIPVVDTLDDAITMMRTQIQLNS